MFLLFQTQNTKIFEHVRSIHQNEIKFSVPGLSQIMRALDEHNGVFELKKFAGNLPADLQEILFDIHSNQDFVKNLQNIDIEAEWVGSIKKLKNMGLKDKKAEIINKISILDEKPDLSEEEMAQHDDLLRELVALNIKEKV